VVRRLCDQNNVKFWTRRGKAFLSAFDDVPLGVDAKELDGDWDPRSIRIDPRSLPIFNTVLGFGDIEPQAYVREYFVGDALSMRFPLAQKMYGVEEKLLLLDDLDDSSIDGALWKETDPGSHISESTSLSVTGGNGLDQTKLVAQNNLEMGGDIDLQHGALRFVSSSDGIVGGLYTSPTVHSQANCMFGFKLTPSGGETAIEALVDGAVPSGAAKVITQSGKEYVLLTRFHEQILVRGERVFFSLRTPSGFSAPTPSAFASEVFFRVLVLDVNDPDSKDSIDLYTETRSDVSAFLSYALLNSADLNVALNFCNISIPINALLKTRESGASDFRQRSLRPASNFESDATVLAEKEQVLVFTGDRAPNFRELIELQYRSAGRARAKIKRQSSIDDEANRAGDSGVRAGLLPDVPFPPRDAVELEQLIKAYIDDRTVPRYTGEFVIDTFKRTPPREPIPGRFLTVNCSSKYPSFQGFVTEVQTRILGEINSRNLLRNSGFEDGLDFWGFSSNASAILDQAKAHTGDSYLQLTQSASGAQAWAYQSLGDDTKKFFRVVPGDVIDFGGWGYVEAGDATTRAIRISALDENKAFVTSIVTPNFDSASWEERKKTYVVAEGIAFINFLPFVNGGTVVTTLRVDDCFMRVNAKDVMNHRVVFGEVSRFETRLRRVEQRQKGKLVGDRSVVPDAEVEFTEVGTAFIADVTGARFTFARTSSTYEVDAGVAPPGGGYFDVRSSDANWGAPSGANLISQPTSQTFTLPRSNRRQSYWLKPVDSAGKVSRYPAFVQISFPLVPVVLPSATVDTTDRTRPRITLVLPNDARDYFGVEIRDTDDALVLYREPDVSVDGQPLPVVPGGPELVFEWLNPSGVRTATLFGYGWNLLEEYSPSISIGIDMPALAVSGLTLDESRSEIRWDSDARAKFFDVEVASASDFTGVTTSGRVAGAHFRIPVSDVTNDRWFRVRADDGLGVGPWASGFHSYTTTGMSIWNNTDTTFSVPPPPDPSSPPDIPGNLTTWKLELILESWDAYIMAKNQNLALFTTIAVANLATTEQYFSMFELQVYNSARTERIASQLIGASWSSPSAEWQQQNLVLFKGLDRGDVFSFRGRVIPQGGGPASSWSSWIDETAGDTTAPSTSYSVEVDLIHKGLIVNLNPSGSPSDHDRFELIAKLTSSTPAASAIPTQIDHTDSGNFFLGQFAGTPVAVYMWARDVDTSGNPQAWVSLGNFNPLLVFGSSGNSLFNPSFVNNPSFEAGDAGWAKGTGWTIEESNPFKGTWAAKHVGATDSALRNSARVPIAPGDRVLAVGYGKKIAGAGSILVRISWRDSADSELSVSRGNSISSSIYSESRKVAIAPANATQCAIEFESIGSDGASIFFVDFCALALIPKDADIDSLLTTNAPAEAGADQTSPVNFNAANFGIKALASNLLTSSKSSPALGWVAYPVTASIDVPDGANSITLEMVLPSQSGSGSRSIVTPGADNIGFSITSGAGPASPQVSRANNGSLTQSSPVVGTGLTLTLYINFESGPALIFNNAKINQDTILPVAIGKVT
jgi:hypothetical protein